MKHEVTFDSIESAHEFLALFSQVVVETKREIEAYLQKEMSLNTSRRLEALQIIAYLLETLDSDVASSRRILNDLRSLRRLLLGERASGTIAAARPMSSQKRPRSRSSVSRPSPGVGGLAASENAVARDVSKCVTVKRRALSSGRANDNPRTGDALPWYVRRDLKPYRPATVPQ